MAIVKRWCSVTRRGMSSWRMGTQCPWLLTRSILYLSTISLHPHSPTNEKDGRQMKTTWGIVLDRKSRGSLHITHSALAQVDQNDLISECCCYICCSSVEERPFQHLPTAVSADSCGDRGSWTAGVSRFPTRLERSRYCQCGGNSDKSVGLWYPRWLQFPAKFAHI